MARFGAEPLDFIWRAVGSQWKTLMSCCVVSKCALSSGYIAGSGSKGGKVREAERAVRRLLS